MISSRLLFDITGFMAGFSFYYPLFMAYVWMIGALNFYFRFERTTAPLKLPPGEPFLEPVTVIIPMHNESENAEETIRYALEVDYPEFEVIAINDGSTDNTAEILDRLAQIHERLRVVHLAKNQGKAVGLETAALVAKHEYLVCIDGRGARPIRRALDDASFHLASRRRCHGQPTYPYPLNVARKTSGG